LLCEEWRDTGDIRFLGFYRRRALRLFPALFLLLLVILIYVVVKPPREDALRGHLKSLLLAGLYVMNWFTALGAVQFNYVSHTWSLSCEEQYYLLWPPLLFVML